ncbi:plant glycogenin-like starch initiation protein 1 [Actinidia rufa]|uniref:Hexosyltransferase n=1 Tax=Actinidia rufa TaxID=165716 RepID=A0A7J0EM51_9ERIC|nr:plant glycogenin-like starch initiation protein 1 [Actinidia rufa]
MLDVPRKQLDLIAVKLPCRDEGNWSRDVARLHLQRAAAQLAASAEGYHPLVILVDETISEYHRSGLEAAGWKIRTIQRIRNPKAKKDAYNEWNCSKFRLWQLTDYDKIIFIDADLLILRNIDFLFSMPEISATGNNGTLFNSGVMVIEPSNCTFQLLMDKINEFESYNGGDQGYLNEIFTWWHRIPKHMNSLKNFWFASDVAHKKWWKVHDSMPKQLQQFCLLRSKQKAQLEWDRRQAEKGNFADEHWRKKIKDPRLNKCINKLCSWEGMLRRWGETNWTGNEFYFPTPPTISKASLSA